MHETTATVAVTAEERSQHQNDTLESPFPFQNDGHEVQEEEEDDLNEETPKTPGYNSKKPTWWKKLANIRATKPQRKAMREMDSYRFQRAPGIPYGKYVEDWDEIFGASTSVAVAGESSSLSLNQNEGNKTIHNNIDDSKSGRNVWIELGCGRGENVLALAHRHRHDPSFAIIGAEIHPLSLGNMFMRLKQARKQQAYWTGYTLYGDLTYEKVRNRIASHQEVDQSVATPGLCRDEWSTDDGHGSSESPQLDPYQNVRVFRGDCMKLITLHTPNQSVSRILVTFPDPFPPEQQREWRLFQLDTVQQFHRVLKASEGYLCLATDHQGYFVWAQDIMQQSGLGWERVDDDVNRMEWLPGVSAYEDKGWREGRTTHLACWKAISANTERV